LLVRVVESEEYGQIDAVRGDTVTMSCTLNQSNEAEWTRNTTHGYSYVYINETITGSHNVLVRFSVVNASTLDYSLKINNVLTSDTGWYDCYETDGRRIVGYYLVAKRKFPIAPV